MLKRLIIVSILILSLMVISKPSQATSYIWPEGIYEITKGKMTFKVNFPGIVTMSLSFPNMGFLQEMGIGGGLLRFDEDGDFFLYVYLSESGSGELQPILRGTWDMTPWGSTKFTVYLNLDYTLEELLKSLSGLSQYNITPEEIEQYLTVTKNSFTGTINPNNGILNGKFALVINVSVYGNTIGTITFSGSYTAVPSTQWTPLSTEAPLSLSGPEAPLNQKNPLSIMIPRLMHFVPFEKILPMK